MNLSLQLEPGENREALVVGFREPGEFLAQGAAGDGLGGGVVARGDFGGLCG